MSGIPERDPLQPPAWEHSLLDLAAARSGEQLAAWFSSLAFHTAVLAVLVWGDVLPATRPKLPGNPEVVTLLCSQASVASPPQKMEVKIPRPEEDPLEAPPPPEQLPPPPEVEPPEPPASDSLETLHAVARNQTPQRQSVPRKRAEPQSLPMRKLLARAQLPAWEAPPGRELNQPPQTVPEQPSAAKARRSERPRKPQVQTARRLPAARQRQLPTPATRAAPLADAAGTDRTQAPRPIYTPEPPYPDIFPRPTGRVWLVLLIGKDGRVRSAKVYKSSGHPALDRAAREAVLRWKWEPATRGGQPVEARIRVGVQFVED